MRHKLLKDTVQTIPETFKAVACSKLEKSCFEDSKVRKKCKMEKNDKTKFTYKKTSKEAKIHQEYKSLHFLFPVPSLRTLSSYSSMTFTSFSQPLKTFTSWFRRELHPVYVMTVS